MRTRTRRILAAHVLAPLLWAANQAWAELALGGDPGTTATSPILAQAAPAAPSPQAPSPPFPPTPPPSTVPSVAPPTFPSVGGPAVPPAATFEFHPSITLSEEYSDNFFLRTSDKRENFRTSLSPGLNVLINGAFTKGQIGYTLSAVHDSVTNDNSLFHSALGQVAWEASPRLTLTVSDVLTRSDEPTKADQLGLRQPRRTFLSNTFSATSDYLIGTIATKEYYRLATFFDQGAPDTTAHTLGASVGTTFYETNAASLGYEYLKSNTSSGGLDLTGHLVSATFTRKLTSFASAGVSGSYELRTGHDSEGSADFTLWSGSLFATYAIPTWSVTASAGYSQIRRDQPRQTENSPVGSLSFSYYFLPGATFTITGTAGFSETFQTGQNFGVVRTRGVTGTFTYPITPFVSGTIGGFYRQNKFTGIGGGPTNTTEDIRGGTASLTLQLLRWLAMTLEYAYTKVDASPSQGAPITLNSYTENRARAALTAAF